MPTLHRTIVRPLITEASSVAYQDRGEYHFEVHPDAKTELSLRRLSSRLARDHASGQSRLSRPPSSDREPRP